MTLGNVPSISRATSYVTLSCSTRFVLHGVMQAASFLGFSLCDRRFSTRAKILYCIVLYYIYCIILYYIILYYIILYCIVLYCIILYYIICTVHIERNRRLKTCLIPPTSYFSEDGVSRFFRNVGLYLPNCTTSQPKRPLSSGPILLSIEVVLDVNICLLVNT